MPSDKQISILVDIAGNSAAGIAPDKLPDLMDLVIAGYVEADGISISSLPKGKNIWHSAEQAPTGPDLRWLQS